MKNQGEIICLIVFVVLTLTLSVTTYFGFKNLGLQKAELATAQTELQNVQNENYSLTAQYREVQETVGFSPSIKSADVLAAMTADVANSLGADSANKSYKDAVAELKKSIGAADAKISDATKARDAGVDSAFASVVTAEEQQGSFSATAASQQTDRDANLETVRVDYDKLTKSFVDQTKGFDSVNWQARDAVVESNKRAEENRELANRFADFNVDMSRRIDELTNANFERADGSVVYADQAAKLVRLDIGADDGVRPLMTFNVYPPEIFEEGRVAAKAKVQVVRTLEAHACEARILEDVATNPIAPGDFVYTSLWKPGVVERYALDCRLDVNGDNFSDLNELVNLIEANGCEVAAFIDDDGVVHGKITPDVTRVVVHNLSLSSVLATDGSLGDAQREAIVEAETSFLEEAKANGVREMRLADFLLRMDYKDTDQVVRDANRRPFVGAKAVGEVRVAPIFDASPALSANPSVGAPMGIAPASDEDEAIEKYFRKRAPNL